MLHTFENCIFISISCKKKEYKERNICLTMEMHRYSYIIKHMTWSDAYPGKNEYAGI